MSRDPNHFYLFDSHLDDDGDWRHGIYDCYECGFEFVYVCRMDHCPPPCPRCQISDRWQRKPAYSA